TVTITAIQPRLRLSGTNRLGFQPSMAISAGLLLLLALTLNYRQDSRLLAANAPYKARALPTGKHLSAASTSVTLKK
ncbi:MAG: hypothetical protein KZQ65_05745, partial [Candidatus Thiodiazotropha sp. (ex Gloverina cf. vestifex)]|nr:hypothetical protein [Candidatus Thiodiazotropha sp. (ex Gloverina cf. vestifex)]